MSGNARLSTLILAVFLCCTATHAAGQEPSLEAWRAFSRTANAGRLILWLQDSARSSLTGRTAPAAPAIAWPPFDGHLGLFVTLMTKNNVRGCYGAFDHPTAQVEWLMAEYLKGALRRDHRYLPVDPGDIENLTIVVTIAGRRLPLQNAADVDIVSYGILATFEDDTHDVVVPAEIRSLDALQKRWRNRPIQQLEAFRAVTIK